MRITNAFTRAYCYDYTKVDHAEPNQVLFDNDEEGQLKYEAACEKYRNKKYDSQAVMLLQESETDMDPFMAWNALKTQYERATLINVLTIVRKFVKDGVQMRDVYTSFQKKNAVKNELNELCQTRGDYTNDAQLALKKVTAEKAFEFCLILALLEKDNRQAVIEYVQNKITPDQRLIFRIKFTALSTNMANYCIISKGTHS